MTRNGNKLGKRQKPTAYEDEGGDEIGTSVVMMSWRQDSVLRVWTE